MGLKFRFKCVRFWLCSKWSCVRVWFRKTKFKFATLRFMLLVTNFKRVIQSFKFDIPWVEFLGVLGYISWQSSSKDKDRDESRR